MATLYFNFLGRLGIHCEDSPLPHPPTIKSQSLLAYLVLHRNQPQPREKLAGMFWGDRNERKARRSLATAVWHIRSCLGDESTLLSDNYNLQINPQSGLWLDVEEFETLACQDKRASLQVAISLYRGAFLEGFYDNWVINRRYQVETLYLGALARLMLVEEAEGSSDAAINAALRLLEEDPLREEAHRTLMRAYCRVGQRSAAIEQYRRAEKIIREELGVDPLKETRQLYQNILEGRIEIGPAPDIAIAPTSAAPVRPSGLNPLEISNPYPFLGRTEEISFLRLSWEATLAGAGRVTLIEGEAGVGKTRLVEEFAGFVRRQGAWVLPGRCYAFERLLSYQPVVEALSSLQNLLAEQEWQNFPAWVLAEVGRLIPEIPGEPFEASGPLPDSPADEQERLFEGLVRFFRQIASQRPLMIVLEDLHWASESTLGLLHYLARQLISQPVLLVGTYRPESILAQAGMRELKNQLEQEGSAHSVQLKPLSETTLVSLVQKISGAGQEIVPLARRLSRETEGNPFFLTEIIKALFDSHLLQFKGGKWQGNFSELAEGQFPLPGSLRETILIRVQNLDEPLQHSLRLAAVLGREFDFEPFCRLCGQDEDAAVRALGALLRHRLIEEGKGVMGRDYIFSHHLIQEVVYAELPDRYRQQAHARAGEALESCYALAGGVQPQPYPDQAGVILPAELAYHFERGRLIDPGLGAKAAHYLLAAGDQARRNYANREAMAFYQQALVILKERNEFEAAARTLMKLGLTYHSAFDFPQARQTYQEAFAFWRLAEEAPPPGPLQPAPHALRLQTGEPSGLDPGRFTDTDTIRVIEALFSGLVQQGPQLEILPDIAQRWDVLEDGRVYVFHLQPEARWSDGEAVQAADFIYAWQRLLDPRNRSDVANLLFDIRGARDFHLGEKDARELAVKALDDATLQVELERPCGYFLNLMATAYGRPVPAHVVNRHGETWAQPEHLVTNGAFRLDSWIPQQGMRLSRNPTYHGRFGGNLEQVELSFIPQWPDGLDLYAGDHLDALEITFHPPQELEIARQRYAGEYRCPPKLATGMTVFDTNRMPFDDRRVRLAFAHAVDREALASKLLRGQVFPASGGFVPPGMPGHTPGIALPFDPRRAQELFAEAGYPQGRGFPEVVSYFPQITARHVVGKTITDQWREILNVQIQAQGRSLGQYWENGDEDRPHIFSYAWSPDYPDPASFLQDSGPILHSRWHEAEYAILIAQARQCLLQEQRMRLYTQAELILVAEAPLIPMFYMRTHLLVKPWVRRFPGSVGEQAAWKDVLIDPHS